MTRHIYEKIYDTSHVWKWAVSLHSYTEMDVYRCVTCHVFFHKCDMCDVSYIFPYVLFERLGDFNLSVYRLLFHMCETWAMNYCHMGNELFPYVWHVGVSVYRFFPMWHGTWAINYFHMCDRWVSLSADLIFLDRDRQRERKRQMHTHRHTDT